MLKKSKVELKTWFKSGFIVGVFDDGRRVILHKSYR